nr:hypothetical protein [Tanacetum cinerariifolium]
MYFWDERGYIPRVQSESRRIKVDYGSENDIQTNEKSIAELHMLTTPKEKEELIIYLAAAKEAASNDRKGWEANAYLLRQSCIAGPGNQLHSDGKIDTCPKVTRRLLKWSFKLEEHDIYYRPKTSIKGKILADFIMKRLEDDPQDTTMEDEEVLLDPWILFTDGSSCIDGFGVGLIITNPKGMEFTYALRFRFDATNNEAEYEAVIAGLQLAKRMRQKNRAWSNTWKKSKTSPAILKNSPSNKSQEENKKADALSKIASTSFAHLSKQVLVEELKEKSIDVLEKEGRTWMAPIHKYLVEGIMPEERKKARAIRHKARRYTATDGVLYKKSFLGPWLRCVGPLHANYVLREIHEGSCSMHAGPVSVVAKALRSGLCEKLCIHQCFASVKHPQANGLVERANRSLGEGIKAWLDERSKNWLEEISHVLWAHRTMIKSSNGETPFSLTYGSEVVIPVEIGMPTLRTTKVDVIKNNEALGVSLDLLKEKREHAAIQEAKSKAKMEKYYNARVRNISFRSGDLVYRNNVSSRAEDGASSDLSGRDHMKSRKHWANERTSLETATEIPFREHGTSATLRNVICTKSNQTTLEKCLALLSQKSRQEDLHCAAPTSNTWSLTTEVGRTTSEEAKVVERVVMGASEVDDLKGGREGGLLDDYVILRPMDREHELFRGWLQVLRSRDLSQNTIQAKGIHKINNA